MMSYDKNSHRVVDHPKQKMIGKAAKVDPANVPLPGCKRFRTLN